MFLKSLDIKNGDVLIREISFHKGINLIVDETKPENKTESGNSVGKTTVLRLIDFCDVFELASNNRTAQFSV